MDDSLLRSWDVGSTPTDVACHPTGHVFACGTMNGEVWLCPSGDGVSHQVLPLLKPTTTTTTTTTTTATTTTTTTPSSVVVRAVGFAGDDVVCAGTATGDLCVLNLSHETLCRTLRGQGDDGQGDDGSVGLHRLLYIDEGGVVCTGDDDGVVALWDVRESKNGPVHTIHPHTDYVADMVFVSHKNALLCVSGDGTLSMADVRMNGRRLKLKHRSEDDADDELLSVCVVRQGQKVVCGTTSGVLNIYSWGYWNDCSDRFPGHPESVTGIVAFDEETILTGSSDGLIRVLNIQPNKMLGVLGEHSDFDIERLALSRDGQFLASISHDHTLKLWKSGLLLEDDDEEEEEDKDEEKQEEEQGEGKQEEDDTRKDNNSSSSDDDSDSDSDSDGDSDSDDEQGGKRRRISAKVNTTKGAHKIPKKQPEKQANFFADLL